LPRETIVLLNGATGKWYRVAIPGDSVGYGFVAAAEVEVAARPLRTMRVANGTYLRASPDRAAAPVDTVAEGNVVPVFGQAAAAPFVLVRDAQGRAAWLPL
jgi:hypothetical protein